MGFVRPEVRALLWRWREVLIGAALVALGLYWAFFTHPGPLTWIGYLTLALGGVLAVTGIQRGRFRRGTGGPGVVQVVERRISYFGPLSGGMGDLDALTSLAFDPTSYPPSWILSFDSAPELYIPVNAEGTDALFDAFASLPGLSPERLAAAPGLEGPHAFVIWERSGKRKPRLRLH